jgi:polysaccharide biosynthesis protein PslG
MQRKISKKVMVGLVSLIVIFILVSGLWIVSRSKADPFKADAITNPAFPSLTYGIQTFLWWDGGEAGLHLDWVRLMSYNHVKQTFAWKDLEPRQDSWDWEQADRIMDEVERRDLRMVARLGQVPEWAQPATDSLIKTDDSHDVPPVDMADWRDFCFTIADRYKGRIVAYQIWNEPNLTREWGNERPDPTGYVALLAACSEEIRRADPDAILISAGLAPTGNNDEIALPDDVYLDQMYRNDFQQYIDVVGVHATGYAPPEVGPDDAEKEGHGRWFTFRRIEDLRKIMISHGDEARQMAIMEFGYTTDTRNPDYAWYAVTEEEQADMLKRAYEYATEHWRPWVGLMTLIYMPSPGWVPEDEEYWWAITTPDKGHRPAFFTLANMRKVCDDFIIPIRESDGPVALGLEPAPVCP